MALLWMDGFDHYGADESNMTDGVYAQVDTDFISLSSANPRTGTHSIFVSGAPQFEDGTWVVRRVFGKSLTTVGFAHAFHMAKLPDNNDGIGLAEFRDVNNSTQVSIQVMTTGDIRVKRGGVINGTTIGETSDAPVTAEQYQHFECKVTIDDSAGAVEVRINGVTVLNLTGVDTKATSESDVRQVAFGRFTGVLNAGAVDTYFDDIFCWDTTGTQNNDFIGVRRVLTNTPDQDTAQADWDVVGAASGFEAINELAPDDDTSYISTSTVNAVSEFGIGNLPAGASVISAVQVVNRMRKEDSGSGNVQVSLVSSGAESNGAARPLTQVYTYWQDVHELDPATAAPWTPDALNAALLKFERTA